MKKHRHQKQRRHQGQHHNYKHTHDTVGIKKIVYGCVLVILAVIFWYGYRCGFEKVCSSDTVNQAVRRQY
jgi:hypothetical protein